MLYYFVRPIAKLGLWVLYRHIHLSHTENIPRDKPVILAANHPTAFIEPCVLACFLRRPLYFLVRGNLFKKPLYDFLLRSLHMLPIFRLKDGGYGKLKHNYS
ncbi:MAG TPA: 1-acyl-sn-glycerol-3-phosphate acyltransferase, partial [Phaeodactylibacter sp.]|nr:1-acyl-sn-glycerol-3-phosphate acyltransferase [Phaeodactylibacter sp.]